ncbi:SsrA-binding protein SmpB [Patescibacteria group bacterium]|nr:SsrA-binding protein SmpB [Patescibacteria group bacterium]MBU2219480.1 SsrA-binding protein SmpB [Patescibacteria group bacterium]MBU2263265.1 SsrA-binding protein SmpB [Patescibacteria group bacterium]
MAVLLENRKAKFDYEILETFEAGLVLAGWEVKSLRNKRGSLAGGHIIIRGNEVYAVGIDIPPYQPNNMPTNFEEQRTLKLLLSKKEIKYLTGKLSQKGLTVVPLKVYTKGRKIKIEIGLAKGKKKFDKREKIKERETKRDIARAMKWG